MSTSSYQQLEGVGRNVESNTSSSCGTSSSPRWGGEITESSHQKKKLGVLSLTVLIFYEVCGGPFGIEDVVRAGGPFYALVGFTLVLVWAVPEALITAELSSAMPEDSGSVGECELLLTLSCLSFYHIVVMDH